MKRLLCICGLLVLFIPYLRSQQIVLTPKWTAQAQFTGYYVADKMGFYKAEGLDVKVQHPSISESSFSFLQKGRAQVVVMNLSQALTARAEGVKVVNIMQTSQTNSLLLVSRTPLKGISSLQNKKIAVWNHLSQKLLDMLAERYKLNIEWIRFNSGVNIFLSKAVDICLVGSYNEFPQLEECGMKVDSSCIFRLSDYGYDLPEDGIYVTEEYYNHHKELIKKLVKASIEGWNYAHKYPEKALDIVMETVRKNNIGTNRYHQRKMLEEILRLQYDKKNKTKTFKLSKEGFDRSMNALFPDEVRSKLTFSYQDFVK